jgi:hypothetical protein
VGLFSRIAGVVGSFFQIGGPTGPGLVSDTGNIDAKNAAQSSYVNVRGADPSISDDLVTKRYGDANYGGGGGANVVQAEVDFGFPSGLEGDTATVTSVPATWVTSTSIIVCTPQAVATPDHDPEDYAIEGLVAYAENIVDGVGFDIIAYAPQGTWGRYYISATGK